MPQTGDIVDYRMSAYDCQQWQDDALENPQLSYNLALPEIGDVQPGLFVGTGESGGLNLRVFLNGRYDIWVKDVPEGTDPGTWAARAVS